MFIVFLKGMNGEYENNVVFRYEKLIVQGKEDWKGKRWVRELEGYF